MKSILSLKILGILAAGSVLIGGGVLAEATLAPQREAARLILTPAQIAPTPTITNPLPTTIQNAPSSQPDMAVNDSPSSVPNPAMGMNGNRNNQMAATPNTTSPGQSGYDMQGNGNMDMYSNVGSNINGQNSQMDGSIGNNMNGQNNWGSQMEGNWGMGGNMGNGMNNQNSWSQSVAASLAVNTPDEAAQVVLAYLANLNNPDLILAEIVPYGEDYHAHIYQQSSGQYGFSLMVDACNGQVWSVNGGQ